MTHILRVGTIDYPIVITVGAERKIAAATNCKLAALLDDKCTGLITLIDDFAVLANVIWLLCEKQATANGVTEEMFVECFDGDTIAAAQDVFIEALARFFVQGGRSAVIRQLWAKAKEVADMGADQTAQTISGIPVEQVMRYMQNGSIAAAG